MRPYNIMIITPVLICLFAFVPGVSADLFVDVHNTSGVEDGSSQRPTNTIQEAIDLAADAGETTIYVAAGEYAENIRVEGKTVHLLGGCAGGASADYAGGNGGDFTTRDPLTHISHIRGDGSAAAAALIDVDGGSLDGFRITGGTGSGDEYRVQGGGVHVYGGSPTISGNTIENNDTRHPEISNVGGGVSSEDSDVRILDNVIRNNHADRGAGIAVNGGSAVIRDNTVQGNIAVSDHGGGLYIGAPDVEISHNMVLDNEVGRELGYGWGGGAIVLGGETSAALSYNTYSGNYAPTAGGGVFVDDGADATLEHELIYDNESVERGAGVYVDGAWDEIGSTAAITNCTIVNNTCTDCMGGCGLFVEYFSNTIIKDSILWGHGGDDIFADETSTAAVTYTISEQSIAGAGNLNSDPLFVDAENNDYHLQSQTGRWSPAAGDWVADSNHSPGIDSGDPASFYVNEPDPNGGRVNMGVHGNSDQAGKGLSGATQPRLDIKANGLDGPVTVQSGDPAAIALSLDPGGRSGQVADWWIIETAPGNTINHFDVGALSFISGVATTHQGPLVALSNLPLPAPAGMTPGTHTFFFIVDMNMNNVLDVDQAFYDLVSVIVSE